MKWAIAGWALLLLAGCGPSSPVAKDANNAEGLPEIDDPAPDPTAAPPSNATAPATSVPAPAATIPAALHGRWGLTPLDCTSTRGDAKGLLVIEPTELRFYESVAVPQANAAIDANSIRGEFRFTGEGQTWTRFQSLRLQGQELVRTESNPSASFSYAKCT